MYIELYLFAVELCVINIVRPVHVCAFVVVDIVRLTAIISLLSAALFLRFTSSLATPYTIIMSRIQDVQFVEKDMFSNEPEEGIRVFDAVWYSKQMEGEWLNGYTSAVIL